MSTLAARLQPGREAEIREWLKDNYLARLIFSEMDEIRAERDMAVEIAATFRRLFPATFDRLYPLDDSAGLAEGGSDGPGE